MAKDRSILFGLSLFALGLLAWKYLGGKTVGYRIKVKSVPSEGGQVIVSPTKLLYSSGEMVYFDAYPNPTYRFHYWELNGDYLDAPAFTGFIITSDVEMVAHFIFEGM